MMLLEIGGEANALYDFIFIFYFHCFIFISIVLISLL